MPKLILKDYELYYEVNGKGIPILFLEGLGYSMWMWKYQNFCSNEYQCIYLDNRGVGKSSPLKQPYSTELFAMDAISILDHLGIESAYILGVSMGGFIAQEIARIAPKRIKGLILVSTSCGGKKSIPMSQKVYNEMTKTLNGESLYDKLKRTMSLAFTEEFLKSKNKEFEDIIVERMKTPTDEKQLIYQSLSVLNFDAYSENSKFYRPALIIAGLSDRVLPWTNSILLFKSLPFSSLLLFENQNHLLFIEKHEIFNNKVLKFIEDVENENFEEKVEVIK